MKCIQVDVFHGYRCRSLLHVQSNQNRVIIAIGRFCIKNQQHFYIADNKVQITASYYPNVCSFSRFLIRGLRNYVFFLLVLLLDRRFIAETILTRLFLFSAFRKTHPMFHTSRIFPRLGGICGKLLLGVEYLLRTSTEPTPGYPRAQQRHDKVLPVGTHSLSYTGTHVLHSLSDLAALHGLFWIQCAQNPANGV